MDSDSFLFLLSGIPLLSILTGSIITLCIIIFLSLSIFLFSKVRKKKINDAPTDDLSKVLELASDGLPEEKEMLKGIIRLCNRSAVEIMTPRMDVSDLNIKAPFNDVIEVIIKFGYSRIPIYGTTQDDIRGILYSKDLLPYIIEKHTEFHWQDLIRPAFFVPENKKIDDLLEDFRKNKIHMAIVVDEFGGTSGIVTLEDILEEIVGEIDDEYDKEDLKHKYLTDGSYIFEAKISLSDFFRVTQLEPEEFGKLTEEADSLAGLILEIKGDFPEKKEWIHYKNFSFQILNMDERRILKVKFIINEPVENETEEKDNEK